MKKPIITIMGFAGTGTSSAARGVADRLEYHYHSSGDHFREIAARRADDVNGQLDAAVADRSIDDEIDARLREIGEQPWGFVIDSRIAHVWIPEAFKVRLHCDDAIAAARIFAQLADEGRLSETASTQEEVFTKNVLRNDKDRQRYRERYDIDLDEVSGFDLTIDTGVYGKEAVINLICKEFLAWYS